MPVEESTTFFTPSVNVILFFSVLVILLLGKRNKGTGVGYMVYANIKQSRRQKKKKGKKGKKGKEVWNIG